MTDSLKEQEKNVRSPPIEEEGTAETMYDELATNIIFYPPVLKERRK